MAAKHKQHPHHFHLFPKKRKLRAYLVLIPWWILKGLAIAVVFIGKMVILGVGWGFKKAFKKKEEKGETKEATAHKTKAQKGGVKAEPATYTGFDFPNSSKGLGLNFSSICIAM